MRVLRRLQELLRQLPRQQAPPEGELPAPKHAEPSEPAPEDEPSEFDDLLAEVGATRAEEDGMAAALALRDATIAGLQEQLVNLRDLGDRLARTEQDRLNLHAEVEGLRRVVEELRAGVEKERARAEKLSERAASWKQKAEERHKTAADRWREIRTLRAEKRELERLSAIRPSETSGERSAAAEDSPRDECDEHAAGPPGRQETRAAVKRSAKKSRRAGLADLMRTGDEGGEE